jgi:hypothetical protein
MATYKTTQLIEVLQEQTESFLQKAVTEWQMLPPQRMLQQPHKKKWSAGQCLQHLNTYGNYYLPAIEKAIAGVTNSKKKDSFTSGWLGNYFTNTMLPKADGSVKKMAAPAAHRPPAQFDSDAVIREFIDQQERLLMLLEKAKLVDLQEAKVPISIAKFIKLKLGDVFMFLIAHNYRHMLQAERALGKTSSSFALLTMAAFRGERELALA